MNSQTVVSAVPVRLRVPRLKGVRYEIAPERPHFPVSERREALIFGPETHHLDPLRLT